MTNDTEGLSRILSDAVADVEPAPDLVSRARQGGHRRLLRRRVLLVSGTAAVAAIGLLAGAAGYQTVTRPTHPSAHGPGAELLTMPTRGDLAHDRAVRAALDRRLDSIGGGHLVWVGTGASGPAAIAVRDGGPRGEDEGPGLRVVLLQKDTHTHDRLRFMGSERRLTAQEAAGWFAFRLDGTVVMLDSGRSMYVSSGRRYTADGVRRDWRRVSFTGGVATRHVTAGHSVEVSQSAAAVPGNDLVLTTDGPTLTSMRRADHTLDWGPRPSWVEPTTPPTRLPLTADADGLAWASRKGAMTLFTTGVLNSPYSPWFRNTLPSHSDSVIRPTTDPLSAWVAYGETGSGDRVVAGEVQWGDDPAQIYAVVRSRGSYRTVWGGAADRAATLPVRVRLPGDGGWVVAAKGKALSYRTRGSWHDAGHDAALIPAGSTAVRVDGHTVPLF